MTNQIFKETEGDLDNAAIAQMWFLLGTSELKNVTDFSSKGDW